MSGRRSSALPRAAGSRPRPPVENCTIMPGQWRRTPSCTWANSAGSLEGLSSGLRTWMCTRLAPASNAACVLSTCSAGVVGTAGLSALRGTEPVMATAITTGVMVRTPQTSKKTVSPALAGGCRTRRRRRRRSLAPGQQGAAPRRLDDAQHRVGGVGARLVGEIHPRRQPDVDAARHQPDVDVRRHRPAVPAGDGAGLDRLERVQARSRSPCRRGPSRGSRGRAACPACRPGGCSGRRRWPARSPAARRGTGRPGRRARGPRCGCARPAWPGRPARGRTGCSKMSKPAWCGIRPIWT